MENIFASHCYPQKHQVKQVMSGPKLPIYSYRVCVSKKKSQKHQKNLIDMVTCTLIYRKAFLFDNYGSSNNDLYGSNNRSSNNDSYGSSNDDSYGSGNKRSNNDTYGSSNNDSYGSNNRSNNDTYGSSNTDSYGSANRRSNNDNNYSSNNRSSNNDSYGSNNRPPSNDTYSANKLSDNDDNYGSKNRSSNNDSGFLEAKLVSKSFGAKHIKSHIGWVVELGKYPTFHLPCLGCLNASALLLETPICLSGPLMNVSPHKGLATTCFCIAILPKPA